ncbi:hypothetical protein J2Y45_003479 [Dyadobacter sp. BE34]|uniref:WD40 repeat domain-containing protein n=1 Tax=Dyadobacter fermentans TaxID=94254 RepID=A0ABU1QYP9_9BACT|nr:MULTISPECIES: hypothetical protein [Dyadobacter]MDR6806287.1 hypothetical protein [Dyadobacter fermentans]MDR7044028.1 hypothetical protein [Dyadobacter sp. BE242]MDR7198339.1 hypothetical protein [Dyadobacter sp. BE34]MDR7216301.1 hypothetical protein [Dyadobacter sp. BE31]MDR7264173.1 hypothetical protein [Dyadobacter sp. BE32]
MKLTLSKVIPSPLDTQLQLTHALESTGSFLMADRWKILLLRPNGAMDLIWQTTDEDIAYKWRGFFDDRLTDSVYDEIRQLPNGFRLLPKEDYQRMEASDLYKKASTLPLLYEAHDGTWLAFAGKKIAVIKWVAGHAGEHAITKTKGKDPICRALHPQQNLIVYGTNHGELFAQPFDQNGFGKTIKISELPNICYQIAFSGDGKRLFVGGLGYIKMFEYDSKSFTEMASISSALRSFELAEDYLVLNKGMHGIDVIKVTDRLQRIDSMDLPFSIDKMLSLGPQRTFLLTSGSTNEWALLNW